MACGERTQVEARAGRGTPAALGSRIMTARAQSAMGRLVALGLAVALAAGCAKDAPAPVEMASVSVDELATLVQGGQCQVVDANGDTTRKRMGVIPGATLLTDYEGYALSELPADRAKKLVFYCSNEHCGASHVAAEKARTAGYQDVAVLPAGIAGWRGAGKPVASL
jgi:rhodanese-related sulfurtransferase